MPKKPLKIIGISPGTRYMGVAVFHESELLDWRVKNMEGKWPKEKMKRAVKITSRFIEHYQPDVLSIKELHPSRTSPNLNRLVGGIRELAKRKRLKIYQYSIKDMESFFHPEGRINKKRLAEIVAAEYPILSHELDREKANKNSYYIRMFEAVALGSICLHQLNRYKPLEKA